MRLNIAPFAAIGSRLSDFTSPNAAALAGGGPLAEERVVEGASLLATQSHAWAGRLASSAVIFAWAALVIMGGLTPLLSRLP
jgi:hypothetical protein